MIILGINSAAAALDLALVENDQVLWEYHSAQATATENLGMVVRDLLAKNGQDFSLIKAVAVARGPGSFTGLRLGVVAAKTLAQSLKIPLVGVSTLEALAWQNRSLQGLLITALKAHGSKYHCALWGARRKEMARLSPDFLISAAKLAKRLKRIKGAHYLISPQPELSLALASASHKGSQTIILEPPAGYLRGSTVARLGLMYLGQDKQTDWSKLLPDYKLPPNIKKMRRDRKFRPSRRPL